MSDVKSRLPIWPFVVVDILFLGLAAVVLGFCRHPLGFPEAGLLVLCGGLGAWSFLTPFLRRTGDEQIFSQSQLLTEATNKIRKLDEVAAHIGSATHQWQELHGAAEKANLNAREIHEKMLVESKALAEFLQRAGESERSHLRVEIDKLRRAEGDRLQVITHMLDHVFALHQAARQTGQEGLIEQIGQFQNACRDSARRIGLLQTLAPVGEVFDAKLHQLPENATAPADARVEDTVIPGYSYQGKIVRRALVKLQTA